MNYDVNSSLIIKSGKLFNTKKKINTDTDTNTKTDIKFIEVNLLSINTKYRKINYQ